MDTNVKHMECRHGYDSLTAKQKRIVDVDVKSLFSPKAFIPNPTIDDIKRLGIFHPTIKYNRGTFFMSEKGVSALKRLTSVISGLAVLSESVSKAETGTQVLSSYNNWIEQLLEPTGQEFVEAVVDALLAIVKDYEFLIQLEGLDIKDQDALELGTVLIQRPDRALLEKSRFEHLDIDAFCEQPKNTLWMIVGSTGSPHIAAERFEYRVTLATGFLAICGAVHYKGAIWRSRVRPVISPLENRAAVSILRWEKGGEEWSVTRRWGGEQDLPLDSASIAYLTRECFLKQLASLPSRERRSELQDAILRSVYWFADAYRDPNQTMQFLKLWSCAECFFAISEEKITEANAKGIASILTFAGFRIIDPKEYPKFKRRLKKLYGLRSEAVHRAMFSHIEIADLDDLSYWIAWIIISMVSLSERGYTTLRQVNEQVARLDGLSAAE
jgi:hypothetical protein